MAVILFLFDVHYTDPKDGKRVLVLAWAKKDKDQQSSDNNDNNSTVHKVKNEEITCASCCSCCGYTILGTIILALFPFCFPILYPCIMCHDVKHAENLDDYDSYQNPTKHSLTFCIVFLIVLPIILTVIFTVLLIVNLSSLIVPPSTPVFLVLSIIIIVLLIILYLANCCTMALRLCVDTCCLKSIYRFTGSNLTRSELRRRLRKRIPESKQHYLVVHDRTESKTYIVTNFVNRRQKFWFYFQRAIYSAYMWTTFLTCGICCNVFTLGLFSPIWLIFQCVPLFHEIMCFTTPRNPCVDYCVFTSLFFGCAPCLVWFIKKKNGVKYESDIYKETVEV